jgi:large subunit ribosomal protein L15
VPYQVVNLSRLAALFPEGGTVGVEELVAAGAVRRNEPVKVLGDGELGGIRLDITADKFSDTAREKIVAAGGTVSER